MIEEKRNVPVCVIIPCYRCSATIRRAVHSVFSQSVIPYEVLLVDDCSGDDTLFVLRELEDLFSGRLKIIQMEKNGGAGSARNAGWALTNQPYIAFLDADDSWHPEKLNIQYEYMQKHSEVALCGHQSELKHGDEVQVLPIFKIIKLINPYGLLFKNAFSTTSPIMLKSSIPFRFKEGMRYSEDYLLWLQIALHGLQVVRIEVPLSYFYKSTYGEGGLSAQLWKMERGELHNYYELYMAGKLNIILFFLVTFFSLAKFVKRMLLTYLRKFLYLFSQ